KHKPPGNYLTLTNPDSFIVTVPPAASRSFAVTVIKGGWVTATVFEDLNGNSAKDVGEPARSGEYLAITPGTNQYKYTDSTGTASLFAKVGAYTLTLTVPDSFVCLTSNPATGTMTDGGSASHLFALSRSNSGTVKGEVYQDKDGD